MVSTTKTLPNWFLIILSNFSITLTKELATPTNPISCLIKLIVSLSTYLGLIKLSGKKVARPKLLFFK